LRHVESTGGTRSKGARENNMEKYREKKEEKQDAAIRFQSRPFQ
jgi:hypothetical protein